MRNSARARAKPRSFPTPVGPRKMNEPIGRLGSCSPARARPYCIGNRQQRLILPDHPLLEPLFHCSSFLRLTFKQARDGDTRPPGDDLGDFFGVDFFFQQGALSL